MTRNPSIERTFVVIVLLLFALRANANFAAPSEQSVSLRTMTGDINGSLLLPGRNGKVPAVLIVAGSGPTDRDGNNSLLKGHNDSLKRLALRLAEAGIASIRYDKRGVAASSAAGPLERELRFTAYAQDAAAWVQLLKADPRFSKVAVIGHSEGSLIGMLAARQAGADAFVSIAGPAHRASTTIRQQLSGRLPANLLAQSDAILASLEQGQEVADVPAELKSLFRESVQPYLISWFKYEPASEISLLSIPIQIAQGDADSQVTVDDAKALKQANANAELVIVNGMNHVLKVVPRDSMSQRQSYGDPSLPVAEALSKSMVSFLLKSLSSTQQ